MPTPKYGFCICNFLKALNNTRTMLNPYKQFVYTGFCFLITHFMRFNHPTKGTHIFSKGISCNLFQGVADGYSLSHFQQNIHPGDLAAIRDGKLTDVVIEWRLFFRNKSKEPITAK